LKETLRRIELLRTADENPLFKAVLMEKSKRDIAFWCDNFVWSFDPRVSPSLFPIKLFDFQVDYLKWRDEVIELKEHGVIAKSRDMGLSWLNIMHQVHSWLFRSGYKGTFISRKQDLVDKIGDYDSIFEKIRFLLRYLPAWMLPENFSLTDHMPFCKIVNPDNGSLITGQTGDDAGRGGRSTVTDIDEYAFIPRQGRLDAAISQNSDVVFYTSTPNGIGDNFYKKFTNSNIKKFKAHWKSDPRKNDYVLADGTEGKGTTNDVSAVYPWYEKQKSVLEDVVLAAEINIDFAASVEGVFIESKWIQAAVAIDQNENFSKLYAALDVATTGKNSNVLTLGTDKKVYKIIAWKGLDTTQTAYKVHELWDEYQWLALKIDADGVGEGVVSTLKTFQTEYEVVALHGAAKPSEMEWPDGLISQEKFANARAEWWSILRYRIKNAYDLRLGLDVDIEDCLQIPNNSTLLEQLSQPLRKFATNKKILVESKEDLRKRNVSSPDYADSLAYLMAPTENFSDWLLDA
jgi:phage terminase large subunit